MKRQSKWMALFLALVLVLSVCPQIAYASISPTYDEAFNDFGKWLQENGTANSSKNKYQYNFKSGGNSYNIDYSISGSGIITITSQTKWQNNYTVLTRVGLMSGSATCDAGAQLLDSSGKLIIADSVTKSAKDVSNYAPLFSQTSESLSDELNAEYLAFAREQVIRTLLAIEESTKKTGHVLAEYGFTFSESELDNTTPLGFENFKAINQYADGQFTDVKVSDWYSKFVETAYNYGLMGGTRLDFFNANGNVTIAETITMAAGIHSVFNTGAKSFSPSTPWYQTYVDYALSNGIISGSYANYNKPATRAEFATILANALPDEGFKPLGYLSDGAIPDVSMTDPYASAVYKLYRAGIVSGSNEYGTFKPQSNIKRSEVSVIIANVAIDKQRKAVNLTDYEKEIKALMPIDQYSYDQYSKALTLIQSIGCGDKANIKKAVTDSITAYVAKWNPKTATESMYSLFIRLLDAVGQKGAVYDVCKKIIAAYPTINYYDSLTNTGWARPGEDYVTIVDMINTVLNEALIANERGNVAGISYSEKDLTDLVDDLNSMSGAAKDLAPIVKDLASALKTIVNAYEIDSESMYNKGSDMYDAAYKRLKDFMGPWKTHVDYLLNIIEPLQ